MNNKLIKNITITNVVLVCFAIVLVVLALLCSAFNATIIAIIFLVLAALMAITSATFDFIKSNFAKKGNDFCKKIPPRPAKIAYLVFGITMVSCIAIALLFLLLYFTTRIHTEVGIGIPIGMGIVAILTGVASLIADSIAINEWRKTKKGDWNGKSN